MKIRRILFVFIPVILLAAATHSQNDKSAINSSADSPKTFLGRWDLTLKAPDREYPSWLELREENGQLQAQMVGRWGNARPLPSAELSNGHLKFVSPKEEEDSNTDLVFEGTLTGKILSGTTNAPDGKTWHWTGQRAPALKRTSPPNWALPIPLFNGKDLTGWHEDKPGASPGWKVQNGTLITPGNGPELVNDSKFEDFKLHVEFNCGPESNSGVYLRGRYEVQIETDSVAEPPTHHTGGVYGFLAPTPELPRKPAEWQTYDITLLGRMVTVVQNDKTIIDNQEIPGITGGALDSHEELPGPIYLQGTEKGHVMFRSIVITPASN
jgi:3-keto-disaccharide hydrolase